MGRPYGLRTLEEIAASLDLAGLPVALRATVIAGYPGETDDDFEKLRLFLSSLRILRSLVVFRYCPEEGTPQASACDDPVPEEIVSERLAVLGALGEAAAASWADALGGGIVGVVSDTPRLGHSVYDAPEVEGTCAFSRKVAPGRLIRCRVSEAWGLDMKVTPLEDGN
jgi:ribosomal protein S12 methylthiotransferase